MALEIGGKNRYYFAQHFGRDPKPGKEGDTELILYFIEFGAKPYADTHQQEEDR